MEKIYKVAIKKASEVNWKIKHIKDLDSFVKDTLNEHKTILLNIDPEAYGFYPCELNKEALKFEVKEKVDLAITIVDDYLD
ncbi:hypothetical protein J7J62_08985 [bacterium]|nr:hypothetical protein [bacterium]